MSKKSALKKPSESGSNVSKGTVGKFKQAASSLLTGRFLGKQQLHDRFLSAVYTNNSEEIRTCVAKGVNPNVIHEIHGVGAIHIAAERGDIVLGFRLLSTLDVDFNLRTEHGLTPLILAAIFHRKRFALMLLQKGADPNLGDFCDRTPMHYCILHSSYSILYNLLKYKANVNVLDAFGNSPLSLCLLENPNLSIAKHLLKLYRMEMMERQRTMHIFFECVLNCHSHGQIEQIILLLDNGIDINMRENLTGRNCLHFVAITGYLHLALVLVERGADLHALDSTQRTPLGVAIEHGNFGVADYLRKGYKTAIPFRVLTYANSWKKKAKEKGHKNKDNSDDHSPASSPIDEEKE